MFAVKDRYYITGNAKNILLKSEYFNHSKSFIYQSLNPETLGYIYASCFFI